MTNDPILTQLLHERELLRLQVMRERFGRIPWWERPKRLRRLGQIVSERTGS